ncbi:MAG: UDP-glucose 4-epimerase GalE, partial [Anaerococcus hydrogenalis]|nr:UDP-glucose 4-epimerase GalE [Anaerococcus hydrogenalis]
KNYKVIVYDNLTNSSKISVKRVEEITGKNITFYEADILDEKKLSEVFKKEKIDVVIHCAALKSVGESVKKPLEYYHNNITGTLSLLKIMKKYSCKNIIFSSSATVYGDPESVPITEDFPKGTCPITEDFPKGTCTNPYGWTKSMMEQIMTDLQKSDPEWKVVLLRYFNPIGAHKSGKIGEDPQGIPNNLLPYIAQVAVGKLDYLSVFGDDYDTVDGTGVIDKLKGVSIFNLATGKGYSVLEVLKAFEKACGKKISYKIVQRREGDIAKCFADASKAYKILGWKAKKDIDEMCEDSWRWQLQNPNGYKEKE